MGLSADIEEFKYHLDKGFFADIEPIEVIDSSVDVALIVKKSHEGIYNLLFRFYGTLTIPCDRCLEPMTLPVKTEYAISVERGERYDDSDDAVLIVPEHWQELDVEPLMRDTVLLAIPIVHCHADGLCDPAMLSYMTDGEIDEDNPDEESDNNDVDPRWEALKKLKQ